MLMMLPCQALQSGGTSADAMMLPIWPRSWSWPAAVAHDEMGSCGLLEFPSGISALESQ